MSPYLAGIDYGSKLAGTTVLAWPGPEGNMLQRDHCPKGRDADSWIEQLLLQLGIKRVYLDAPLSLPGVFRDPQKYTDHFFRQADREAGAMSPMFLGGLTARAIRLKARLESRGILFQETYPAGLARELGLPDLGYKQQQAAIEPVRAELERLFPEIRIPARVKNWHEMDAILALLSGYRHERGIHRSLGDPEEGLILF